ncbi:acetyltransferase [Proteus hauseri]|uniref:acetyltransferase n=1 Tax=Proteus hauseri TaxID=183417 RepID=UPI0010095B68|nr:acetyltransferase [Proteus hauseri]QAV24374.1 acetyltransferase [Proteus hauseri]
MKKEIKAPSSVKNNDQPYWPSLKLILSSLIVFNFYLNLVDKNKFSLLINIFDLTLIPMFVFIVAFSTKNITWETLRYNLLPSIIIYFTFQTVDMIPLYYSGEFNLKYYFFSPQSGVWFFLAIPIWQAFFLVLSKNIKSNNIILFLLLIISLISAYLTKKHLLIFSSFFSIILYFPFFIIAYFINDEKISLLRKKSISIILCMTILAITLHFYQNNINDFVINITKINLKFSLFITYTLNFIVSIILGSSIIYFSLSTNKYAKISNNAIGIYLIHPIICFVFLQVLAYFCIELNLLLIIILTLFTISISLLLTLNSTIHWFIEPVLRTNKLKQ